MKEYTSYRELEIYQRSKKLALRVHKRSLRLPKFELYEEGSQIRRSAKAVTAAIVEGYGRRRYKADFIKHLIVPISECDETILHLDFLFESGSMTDEMDFRELRSGYDELSKMINSFTQWVEKNWKPGPNEVD
jgi:four helix bundle protein